MNLNDIKQISIREYLERKGIFPARGNEAKGMYFSPLRKDNNCSFSVDYIQNIWYDHGIGEGGSIIDLVSRLENYSIYQAIKQLEENSFSFHRNENILVENPIPAIKLVKVTELSNPALLSYLNERQINTEIAKLHCSEIHYLVNDKPYFAIGFPNDAGGYELRNKYFKGCTSKDISSLKTGNESCQLFEGFMDFLSFLTMKNQERPTADVIVLNSLANLSKTKNILPEYKNIIAFLDNDEAGKKAIQELKTTCKEVIDQSVHYANCKDLNEYLCHNSKPKKAIPKRNRGLRR
jgi:DNA primase